MLFQLGLFLFVCLVQLDVKNDVSKFSELKMCGEQELSSVSKCNICHPDERKASNYRRLLLLC